MSDGAAYDRLLTWTDEQLEKWQAKAFDDAMSDNRSHAASANVELLHQLREELLGIDPPDQREDYRAYFYGGRV